MKTDPIGLYIHVPFCIRKCNYCDFSSFTDISNVDREMYVERLCREITSYSDKQISLDTIFFGGGTPTVLSCDGFEKIFLAIRSTFNICHDAEITVETNPGTVTVEKILHLKKLGVNRFSIGLQSIHENELKILGRIHDCEAFKTTFDNMRSVGIRNINVDIMYGIPEQTKESFTETLSQLIDIAPEHISVYGLILEPKTHFFDIKDTLTLPSEDDECDMYFLASDMLGKAGYFHYEISNYAKCECESRHNLNYWHDGEYIGVGVSAYSYYRGERYGNTKSISDYLQNKNIVEYREIIDLQTEKYEYVMLAMRLGSGFSLSDYKARFGEDFVLGREEIITELLTRGYMKMENDRIFLTDRGLYVSNYILTELL